MTWSSQRRDNGIRHVAHEPRPRSTFQPVPRSTGHIKVRTKGIRTIVNLDVGPFGSDDLPSPACDGTFPIARMREAVAALESIDAFSKPGCFKGDSVVAAEYGVFSSRLPYRIDHRVRITASNAIVSSNLSVNSPSLSFPMLCQRRIIPGTTKPGSVEKAGTLSKSSGKAQGYGSAHPSPSDRRRLAVHADHFSVWW